MYFDNLKGDYIICTISTVHDSQWVLLCFFDIKHYLKNNDQDQKEKNAPQCIQEKVKGRKLMTSMGDFKQIKWNICFEVTLV